jgi:hypothetical protein
MAENLSIQITKAGKEAAFNVAATGLALEISHVAFGDQGWNPVVDDEATALRNEILRVPIISGEKLGSSQIHLTAKADGPADFIIKEVGFFLSDGTLFGVFSSDSVALAYKMSGTEILVAFDLLLSTLPPDSVQIIVEPGSNFNPSFIQELIHITLGNIKIATAQMRNLNRIIHKII